MLDRLKSSDPVIETLDARVQTPRISVARALAQVALMLAVLAVSAVVMNRLIAASPERSGRPNVNVALPVDAVVAQAQDQRPTIRLFGQVTAINALDLRPSVAGEVVFVSPDLVSGRTVEEGQLLFSIDRFDYETALAEAQANLAQTRAAITEIRARLVLEQEQLESAQEQLDFAITDLERAERLSGNGTVTQQQLEMRRLTVSQRAQTVSQRRNNLEIEQARLAQQLATEQRLELGVARAERDLADTDVTAPFGGVVRATSIERGRIVSTNDAAVSMYDANTLDVSFTLTDAQFGRISVDSDPLIGRTVDVVWTVGETDYVYEAIVERVGADIASDRGGVTVFARLAPDSHPVDIRPGAFVAVQVPDRLYPDAVRVPETALYNATTVYVIVDGALEQRTVRVAGFDGEDVIVASGINDGDRVLTTRLSAVEEGLPVIVPTLDGQPDAQPNGQERPQGGQGSRGARRGMEG